MSRTYRLRHCPSLPGTAKHFAFTARSKWRRNEEIVLAVARKLAPDVFVKIHDEPYLPWLTGSPDRCQNADARSVLDVLEGQIVFPLGSPHCHPWRKRYAINIRAAKFYRKVAHRNIRRIVKYLLNKSPGDVEDRLMPLWYEHWDRRRIT